eukprot:1142409-Pelagomonas_calceolata.AAC.5
MQELATEAFQHCGVTAFNLLMRASNARLSIRCCLLGAVAAVAVGSLIGLQQPALAAQDVDDSLTKNAVEEYSRLEASGKFSVKGSSMASKTLEDFRSKYR